MKQGPTLKLTPAALVKLSKIRSAGMVVLKRRLQFGHNRSKALNATPRTWKQNLQKCTIIENQHRVTIVLPVRLAKTLKFARKAA